MKILKEYYILMLPAIAGLVFYLGIYQTNTLQLGSLTVSKPYGYRFHSISDNLSFIEVQKHLFGWYTSFELDNKITILNFRKFYLNHIINLQVWSFEDEKFMFMFKYKENYQELIDEEKCIYKVIEENKDLDNLYSIDGLIKNRNISFFIIGHNEIDVTRIKEDICK